MLTCLVDFLKMSFHINFVQSIKNSKRKKKSIKFVKPFSSYGMTEGNRNLYIHKDFIDIHLSWLKNINYTIYKLFVLRCEMYIIFKYNLLFVKIH